MPSEVAAASVAARSGGEQSRRQLAGFTSAAITALTGGAYFVFSRVGVVDGLGGADMAFLRFAVAGAILMPVLLWRGAVRTGGVGWRHAVALTCLGGPLFSYMQVGGLQFAPLAHGSIIMPASVTLSSKLLAVAFNGEPANRAEVGGIALIVLGLLLIGLEGLLASAGVGTGQSWIGDLMFAAAGLLWASYSLLIKRWRADPILATGLVAALGTIAVLPLYVGFGGLAHLGRVGLAELGWQVVGQGIVGGLVMVTAYSRTVVLLGPSRAGLFPSFVPGVAMLFAIPVLGELPTRLQLLGLAIVTLGILIAIKAAARRGLGEPLELAAGDGRG